MRYVIAVLILTLAASAQTRPRYDLLLKGGHVIDPKNNRNGLMDVAVENGKVARVAVNIPAAEAARTVDVSGLYVTPGLIDIHVHLHLWREAGGEAVQADAFSFRSGVTTMVDAGSAGAETFDDFRDRIIRHAKTRVLAFLNIASKGMGTGHEDDAAGLDAAAASRVAQANPDMIVGFKSAHYAGPGWESVSAAVKAGEATGLPVMVDFGRINTVRNLSTLFLDKLRPGDIYTHCYSGHRQELLEDGKLNPAMEVGRKRGIIFDLGHGAGSFYWYVAVPAYAAHFYPDSISTDLHVNSMNAGMKDFTNTMSKLLNLGSSLADVVRMSTWNPAKEIRRPALGNLDVGSAADIAVLQLSRGSFGFVDSAGARRAGDQLLSCELTLREGKVVWDRNGRASLDWQKFPYDKQTWVRP